MHSWLKKAYLLLLGKPVWGEQVRSSNPFQLFGVSLLFLLLFEGTSAVQSAARSGFVFAFENYGVLFK